MILYLDTSALVKLYVREPGSALLHTYASKADALSTSVVAYAEARATFGRLAREGAASKSRHQQRLKQFESDWEALLRIDLVPEVLRSAGNLAETYALRGFDSIHLASALWLSERASVPIDFAAFDRRLAAAASKAGLSLAPNSRT